MSDLRVMWRAEQKRQRTFARELKARTSYGVFRWRGDNRYALDTAEFVYRHQGAADRKARQLGDPYVVRSIISAVNPIQRFQPRFLTDTQLGELSNLWHLSRTALSGRDGSSRYKRMLWASDAFHKAHPHISSTAAYKDLDAMLAFGGR